MAWYLTIYLLIYAALGFAGIVDDWRSRRTRLLIVAMVLTLGIGVVCVLAFGVQTIGQRIGEWLWPMLAFALTMEIWSLVSDFRDMTEDEKISKSNAILGILLAALVSLPAYVLGVAAAMRVTN